MDTYNGEMPVFKEDVISVMSIFKENSNMIFSAIGKCDCLLNFINGHSDGNNNILCDPDCLLTDVRQQNECLRSLNEKLQTIENLLGV